MILTVTLTFTLLVFVNLLLLKFSCNKTVKTTKVNKQPVILAPYLELDAMQERLAPTGS
ncbi:hypothetical protein [Algibacter lectus]|uniref:Uncharacterized protein n=1 Tax=Algibacter lectus TaxID=221126 RepID=A0A090VAN4_9FLAO|nr:hypothetical protein [Algibacter lectus]MDO7136734.1 hypothetical protein [Algibacter lectus]MWW26876.1 hypothetical protein [Algibacter lectus]TDY63367.1 hypothetical protein DFQ06_0243 [Algibacter lectus]SFD50956.1 hypothetical protein SAMN04489722_11111 [Algibacter lectus]GAL61856.1 hypothetical protein JCM19300_602 [Algibacter lectus]